jgi:hypothetical protein
MNTKHAVGVSEAERAQLRTLIGQGTAPARQLTRAAAAQGQPGRWRGTAGLMGV